MFTGLVQDLGLVKVIKQNDGLSHIEIETRFELDTIQIGASISCNGCCLTVVEKTENTFSFEVSLETLDKTSLGDWSVGTSVNLEPSLKLGDELGGHLVSGHVDGLAIIQNIEEAGESWKVLLKVPQDFKQFIAPKGSICLDGVSLTVNEVVDDVFAVNIIPHTWNVTNFQYKKAGDAMNMEVDLIARYIGRMMEVRGA